jgi:hypothetical protein
MTDYSFKDFADLVAPNEVDGADITMGEGFCYQRLLDAIKRVEAKLDDLRERSLQWIKVSPGGVYLAEQGEEAKP